MAKGCVLGTGYLPRGGLPRNSVDRITDRPDMTSAVDHGRKASTQTQTCYIKPTCSLVSTYVLCAQCHTNRNYGGYQILSVVCYMLYQTDLFISFYINATKCKPKKYFSHKGTGREYVSILSNAYPDLYDINSK